MAYTVKDVLRRARQIAQDAKPEYRVEDGVYINYLNDALFEVRRLRPDLFIASNGVVGEVTMENLEDDLGIDGMYFTSVVDYVGGMVSAADDKFSPDGRSAMLMDKFMSRLVGAL